MRVLLAATSALLALGVGLTLDLQQDVAQARQVETVTPAPDPALIDVTGPDGVVHTGCVITVAEPSSTVTCRDGFTEES